MTLSNRRRTLCVLSWELFCHVVELTFERCTNRRRDDTFACVTVYRGLSCFHRCETILIHGKCQFVNANSLSYVSLYACLYVKISLLCEQVGTKHHIAYIYLVLVLPLGDMFQSKKKYPVKKPAINQRKHPGR